MANSVSGIIPFCPGAGARPGRLRQYQIFTFACLLFFPKSVFPSAVYSQQVPPLQPVNVTVPMNLFPGNNKNITNGGHPIDDEKSDDDPRPVSFFLDDLLRLKVQKTLDLININMPSGHHSPYPQGEEEAKWQRLFRHQDEEMTRAQIRSYHNALMTTYGGNNLPDNASAMGSFNAAGSENSPQHSGSKSSQSTSSNSDEVVHSGDKKANEGDAPDKPGQKTDQKADHLSQQRLEVLDDVTEDEREYLVTHVINNHNVYGPLADQMLELMKNGEFHSEAFLQSQMFNTLLYTYINRADAFSEDEFLTLQFWTQLQLQLSPHAVRPPEVEWLPTESVEVLEFNLESFSSDYQQDHARELAIVQQGIASLPRHQRLIVRLTLPAEEARNMHFAQPDNRVGHENKKLQQYTWLHYACEMGFVDLVIPEARDDPLTVLIPLYPVYRRLIEAHAQVRNAPPVRIAPRYGQTSELSLFRLREQWSHPAALWHPHINGIMEPDNLYAGVWLAFLHDLSHAYILSDWSEDEVLFIYELYKKVGRDISRWVAGDNTLPQDFLELMNCWLLLYAKKHALSEHSTVENIRLLSSESGAGYDFNLIDLSRMHDKPDTAAAVGLFLFRNVLTGADIERRPDLLLAKNYMIYLLNRAGISSSISRGIWTIESWQHFVQAPEQSVFRETRKLAWDIIRFWTLSPSAANSE